MMWSLYLGVGIKRLDPCSFSSQGWAIYYRTRYLNAHSMELCTLPSSNTLYYNLFDSFAGLSVGCDLPCRYSSSFLNRLCLLSHSIMNSWKKVGTMDHSWNSASFLIIFSTFALWIGFGSCPASNCATL